MCRQATRGHDIDNHLGRLNHATRRVREQPCGQCEHLHALCRCVTRGQPIAEEVRDDLRAIAPEHPLANLKACWIHPGRHLGARGQILTNPLWQLVRWEVVILDKRPHQGIYRLGLALLEGFRHDGVSQRVSDLTHGVQDIVRPGWRGMCRNTHLLLLDKGRSCRTGKSCRLCRRLSTSDPRGCSPPSWLRARFPPPSVPRRAFLRG